MKEIITVHNPSLKRKDLEYVLESMIVDSLEYGDFAKQLEGKIAEKTGCKYCKAVNSYYSAIDLIFEVLDLCEGDEIIIPSYSPKLYLDVILKRKLKPVIIDLAERSYFPSIDNIKNAITDKTKALIIVHNFGYTIDCSAFTTLVPNLIEDITKVPGATAGSKNAGTFGRFSVCSFSSSEMITTGEGAAVFTNDKKDHTLITDLLTEKDEEEQPPYKYKFSCLISDLNAAMGVSQLSSLDYRLNLRKKIGKIYEESILKSRASFIAIAEGNTRYYSDFPIQIRSGLKDTFAFFKKNGVEVLKPYIKPLHQYMDLPKEDFPETEKIFLTTILIPSSSNLLRKDVDMISKLLMVLL